MLAIRRPQGWLSHLAPLDVLTLVYVVSSLLILTVQAAGAHAFGLSGSVLGSVVFAHILLVLLVFLAAEARQQRTCTRPCLLAEWYPLVVLLAVYGSLDLINGPREAVAFSYDAVVQRWELATFGRQLAHDWSRSRTASAMAWPLSLSYLAFFPMVISAPAVLWWRGHFEPARQTIFGISLAFFTCYLVFLLFPVAGPNYLWGWPAVGGHVEFPARMVRDLIDRGDSWGSAFPSSHVAGSMAAVLLAFRNWRPLGWTLLPFALAIVVGVVYFQVHYAVDAVAGLSIAVLATMASSHLCPLARPAT